MNFTERRFKLGRRIVVEPARKYFKNLRSTAAADGHDKWKSEFLAVEFIERLKPIVFLGRD